MAERRGKKQNGKDDTPKAGDSKAAGKPDATHPLAGHNENGGLTEDQRMVLLLQGVRQLERLVEKKDGVIAEIRNARKKLKADGFSREEVDYALRLRKQEPEDETGEIERWQKLQAIARYLGHPVGSQFDMFPDRTPAADKAFEDGKRAGIMGEPAKPPHDPSVPQFQRWLAGHAEGRRLLAEAQRRDDEFSFKDDKQPPAELGGDADPAAAPAVTQ